MFKRWSKSYVSLVLELGMKILGTINMSMTRDMYIDLD